MLDEKEEVKEIRKYEYFYQEDELRITKMNECKISLDPNHTHHLMKKVDRRKNQLGGQIGWWMEVENLILDELKCPGPDVKYTWENCDIVPR